MNHKGMMEEGIELFIAVIGAILVIFFLFLIISNFNDGLQSSSSDLITNTTKTMSDTYTDNFSAFDYLIPLLMMGIIGGAVYGVRQFSEFKEWIIPAAILLMIVLGFFGMILENVYNRFTDNSTISSVASNFPVTDFVMNNYIIVVLLGTVVIVLAGVVRNE
jgi:hypothetical protein